MTTGWVVVGQNTVKEQTTAGNPKHRKVYISYGMGE
jgi:hypothetical protein